MAATERPNGTRVNSLPFPTSAIDKNGGLLGPGNMPVNTTDTYQFMSKEPCSDIDALRIALVEQALSVFTIEDIKNLMKEIAAEMDQTGFAHSQLTGPWKENAQPDRPTFSKQSR